MDASQADDIHPKYKRPAGERFTLLPRVHVYGEKQSCDLPEFREMQAGDGKMILRFANESTGIILEGEKLVALGIKIDGEPIINYLEEIAGIP